MEMKEKVLKKFAEVFGDTEGVKSYFAPGRVNLIGEHTDYNGGHVFPCALTIGTYGAARKREDRKLRFFSMNFEHLGVIESSLDNLTPEKKADWTNYPKGVMWAFEKRDMKIPYGMDLVLCGNIPNGSGLSSSASLEVLTGFILRDMFGFDVTNQDLALIGQYSENNFNGVNCGIMDQFAIAMGKRIMPSSWIPRISAMSTLPSIWKARRSSSPAATRSAAWAIPNTTREEASARPLLPSCRSGGIKSLGDLNEEQFEQYKSDQG